MVMPKRPAHNYSTDTGLIPPPDAAIRENAVREAERRVVAKALRDRDWFDVLAILGLDDV